MFVDRYVDFSALFTFLVWWGEDLLQVMGTLQAPPSQSVVDTKSYLIGFLPRFLKIDHACLGQVDSHDWHLQ
jgi:hypothetical protein